MLVRKELREAEWLIAYIAVSYTTTYSSARVGQHRRYRVFRQQNEAG